MSNFFRAGASSLIAAFAMNAFAEDQCVDVASVVSKDGLTIATPRMLSPFDRRSSLQVDAGMRFELTATDGGDRADLQMAAYTADGGQWLLLAQPRLLVQYGKASRIELTTKDGKRFGWELTASRRPCVSAPK